MGLRKRGTIMKHNIEEIKRKLKKYNQEHLLNFYDSLEESKKEKILDQIDKIDFELINSLYNKTKNNNENGSAKIEPISFIDKYVEDVRSGVVKILESAEKRINAIDKETSRVTEMMSFERKYYFIFVKNGHYYGKILFHPVYLDTNSTDRKISKFRVKIDMDINKMEDDRNLTSPY